MLTLQVPEHWQALATKDGPQEARGLEIKVLAPETRIRARETPTLVAMEEFSKNRAVEVTLQLTRAIKTLLLQTLSDLLPTQDHLDKGHLEQHLLDLTHLDQGPLEQHLLDQTHLDHHRMDQDHLVQAQANLQDQPTVHLLPPKVDSRGLQQILEIEVGPKWEATMVATTTIPSTLPTEVAIAVATIIMTLIVTDIVAIPSAGIKAVGATIRAQAAVEAAITATSFVHIVVMASKKAMSNAMMETMTPWTGKFQTAYSF
jgi:hypothetical protein